MSRNWPLAVLALALSSLSAQAGMPEFEQQMAVQESLSRVHPRMRARWLRERGLDDSYYTTFRRPESTGLREIGRWPWGPSRELAGRDTFLYLGSGSGVRILSISDSVQPRMLGQIVCRGLVSQVVVQDSLLFVACGGWGAQVYSVTDPANPRELGSMDAVVGDLCVKDTFCYTVGGDSLRVYNVANPTSPFLVGAKRDSGDLVVVANGHAFCAGRWVTNIYNVTNPASPVWANSLGGPRYAMFIRRNLLFCTAVQPDYMAILNVADPLNIYQVGRVNGYGGDAVSASDSFAYLSCDYDHSGLFVIDVGDSSRPQLRDSLDPEGITEWETYAPNGSSYGYLADDYGGLVTVDLHDVNSISEAWSGFKAHQALDICIDGERAYVTEQCAGLRILNVQDPTNPWTLGEYDTVGVLDVRSAVAKDSFAFTSWGGDRRRFLRVLNVSDPAAPIFAAEESCFNNPNDLVLRDSFLYAAEANRFQVFNVARPREPVRVGSCDGVSGYSVCLVDTLAYLGSSVPSIVCVADPSNPQVVGQFGRGAWNVSVSDTLGFLSSGGVLVYSTADPSRPRLIDSISLGPNTYWVEAVGTLLYTGNRDGVHVIDASDIHNMRARGFSSTPYTVDRLTYKSPYIYAACWEAGVCILESTQVAVEEPTPQSGPGQKLLPTVVRGAGWMNLPEPGIVMDAAGRRVAEVGPGRARPELRARVYFVRGEGRGAGDEGVRIRKVVVLK